MKFENRKMLVKSLLAPLFLVALPLSVNADILYDTGLDGTSWSNHGNESGKAIGFTMGSTGYYLDSIQVKVRSTGDGGLTAFRDQSFFSLHAGTVDGGDDRPGTKLVDLDWQIDPTTTDAQIATLIPDASVTLEANTTYWFALYNNGTDTGEDDLEWAYSTSSTPTSSVGVVGTSPQAWYTVNSSVWNDPSAYGTGSDDGSSGTSSTINDMVVNGTVIPEPSTLVLVLGCGVGLIACSRRKK